MAIKEDTFTGPRPQYYITRPDGARTALIAVDELPSTVCIVDVPTSLTKSETQRMICVGEEARSTGRYAVLVDDGKPSEDVSLAPTIEDVAPAPNAMDLDPLATADDPSVIASGTGANRIESWVNRIDDQAYGESQMIPNRRPSPVMTQDFTAPGGAPPIYGRKVYCTHWLRHGECDFIQQGCLYKHEMPDELTLKSIGIRPYPRWYMEAHPERFGSSDANSRYGWGPTSASHAQSHANSFETSQSTSGNRTQYPFGTDNAKIATYMAAGTYASNPPYQPPIPWSAYNAAQQDATPSLPNGTSHSTRTRPPFPPSRTAYVHQVATARGIPPAPSTIVPPSIPGSPQLGSANVNIPKPPSAFNSDRRPKQNPSLPPLSPLHSASQSSHNPAPLSVLGAAGRNGSIVSTASIASTVNRRYVPLTPQRAPSFSPASFTTARSSNKEQQKEQKGKENGRLTPPGGERVKHKRLFVPRGASEFVENVDGGDWGMKARLDSVGSTVKKAKVEDEK